MDKIKCLIFFFATASNIVVPTHSTHNESGRLLSQYNAQATSAVLDFCVRLDFACAHFHLKRVLCLGDSVSENMSWAWMWSLAMWFTALCVLGTACTAFSSWYSTKQSLIIPLCAVLLESFLSGQTHGVGTTLKQGKNRMQYKAGVITHP